jgi:hypothetical protein
MVIPGDCLGGLGGSETLRLIGPGFARRLGFSRSSAATLWDVDGTVLSAAADAPRFSGPAGRLLLEGQRSNSIRNPRAEGAVAGTPGTLPTSWQALGSEAVTRGVTGSGIEGGIPYLDVRYAGTSTTANQFYLLCETTTGIPAAQGETWTFSCYIKLVAGTLGAAVLTPTISERSSGGSFIVTGNGPALAPTGTGLPSQRIAYSRSLTGATTGRASPGIGIAIPSGATVDFTLRLALPQMERAASASSPILPAAGSPGAVTRAADQLSGALSALFRPGAGTLLLGGVLPQVAPPGIDQLLLQIDDGTAENALLLRNAAGTGGFLAGRALAGAVANAAASASVTPGTPFALGLAFDGSGLSLLLRGDTEKALATTMPTGLTTLRVGGGIGGANALFGELGELRVLPYRASAAEMALLLASF